MVVQREASLIISISHNKFHGRNQSGSAARRVTLTEGQTNGLTSTDIAVIMCLASAVKKAQRPADICIRDIHNPVISRRAAAY